MGYERVMRYACWEGSSVGRLWYVLGTIVWAREMGKGNR